MISKEIAIGEMLIDKETGRLWINDLRGCRLRVTGIEFQNDNDSFTRVDISHGKGCLFKEGTENFGAAAFETFIQRMVSLLGTKIVDPQFLNNLYSEIQQSVNHLNK